MTNDSHGTRELFENAVELPAGDRAAFLDRECPHPVLRAQVERLLAADAAAAQRAFLPPPAEGREGSLTERLAAADAALAQDPLLGQRLGRYHIKSLLGVGGMARVYEAVQEQPHCVVALKVMNNRVTGRSALRRFQYESQVLGRLRHPNIAQVYEAGVAAPTGDGARGDVPYFAMEYLPGARPITQFAVDKGLDVRRRLEWFIKVCDAVHHGHQKGVIHRDLKPANLLVESSGTPKVIDFGVARGTDSDIALTTQQTHLGELVGTMQYMSPEQCDGDPHGIDTRSDVYSLGIVLYELLAGTPPYSVAESTIYKAARIIREHVIVNPSAVVGVQPRVARRLRGDLDTIVLKAIERDRDRRYGSAAALADDLRRWLNCEPIQARRPTAWWRVTRWVYRRPAATMLIASTLLSAGVLGAAFVMGPILYWYRSAQIVKAEVSDDGESLRVLGRDSTPIFQSTGESSTFNFAAVLEPPMRTEPARPLLVGVGRPATDQFQSGLNVFDGDRFPSRRIAVLHPDASSLPEIGLQRGFEADTFEVSTGLVADVFPSVPGDEVVVAFQSPHYTQTGIVVFDLSWEVRYCVWVDGQIDALYWMTAPGRLVLLGCNGHYTLPERGIDYRPEPDQVGLTHPPVVFAIDPLLDYKRGKYIAAESDERETADAPLRPAWYWMLPPSPVARTQALIVPTSRSHEDAVRVDLEFQGRTAAVRYSVAWTLDRNGRVLAGPEFPDTYASYRNKERPGFEGMEIPGPDHWKLVELPPVKAGVERRPPGSPTPTE